ncbi:hypothetical protein V7S43_014446 [Phytophthora oleae]|uniref:Uncharacterized protein n=1 Tax=Phytophthora oleae TaxID=2107226 RepID=A0ABD3F1K2_9STRA
MPSSLLAHAFVLLTPDMIKFSWECPIYGKVKKKSALVNSVVSAQEARSNTSGPILRQAVVLEHEDSFHFGQVITLAGCETVVRLMDETDETPIAAITPTAPVVALLLHSLALPKTEWALEEILELTSSIVDKVCGSGTSAGSKDIATILEEFVDTTYFPRTEDEIQWTDPKTGVKVVFPLQHGIDYAYYVDGHVTPVPDTVGTSFCRPPSPPARTSTRSRTSSHANRSDASLELFNTLIDDDDDDVINEPTEAKNADESARASHPSRKRRAEDQLSVSILGNKRTNVGSPVLVDTDAEIAQILGNRPELVERFLQLRAAAVPVSLISRTLQPDQTPELPHTQSRANSVPQRLSNPEKEAHEWQGHQKSRGGDARSKYAFTS